MNQFAIFFALVAVCFADSQEYGSGRFGFNQGNLGFPAVNGHGGGFNNGFLLNQGPRRIQSLNQYGNGLGFNNGFRPAVNQGFLSLGNTNQYGSSGNVGFPGSNMLTGSYGMSNYNNGYNGLNNGMTNHFNVFNGGFNGGVNNGYPHGNMMFRGGRRLRGTY